ncbi:DNA (cytosine-5-)-methyltransferase [Candidatus Uhrbacteria bacterium RIFCSPHIGHO2_02_FULL_53_13]|uniref:Cytosine-specific methyltransferase n=1 Tax=Candidatus Uhrbacteria bacterium RIFCSPHIGHO2_02_FULL_53_13 TaxID=1802389 RepID=A0A1F7U1B4_9BACT|nr:MAG: DNA (cytosine-5-)-methyltransferase [Candidatus Uhrbacteria bacterium RIFCSPHIGHO2_02_FULL_53_13]
MKNKKKYKVASLFSGCGGMDFGAEGGFQFLGNHYEKHDTQTVYATDFDKSICEIYNSNFPIKIDVRDIRDIKSEEIPNHDILTGGFPCQSFSVIAQNPKRLGSKDPRGRLFFEMCRILKEKRPLVFVAENVKGLLSANNGEAFPLIIKEFELAGYHVKYKILNASHYGVPQKRERVFIVGFKGKKAFEKFEFPEPVTEKTPIPISSILIQEKEIEEKFYFSEKAVKGMNSSKHAKTMNKGRAQKPHEPCNTVGAHLSKVSLNSTDPVLCIQGRYRMFTPREVARIQSFPDNFTLSGSKTINYKALGNAVAPVVMWHVTKKIIQALQ